MAPTVVRNVSIIKYSHNIGCFCNIDGTKWYLSTKRERNLKYFRDKYLLFSRQLFQLVDYMPVQNVRFLDSGYHCIYLLKVLTLTKKAYDWKQPS